MPPIQPSELDCVRPVSRHRVWPLLLVVSVLGCSSLFGPDEDTANDTECHNTAVCRDTPFQVPGVPALAQISSGSFHTCGLSADGVAWCWGSHAGSGESGSGGLAAPVPGAQRFVSIGAGRYHNCALTAEGIAYCWTPGESGAAFCGPTPCTQTPIAVGPQSFQALAVGAQHTCALDLSGAAWCWGFNWMGETSSTRLGQPEWAPILVSDSLTFGVISANHSYTCALTLEGGLYCWGWGGAGQLGVEDPPACDTSLAGPVYCSPTPVPVSTAFRLTGLSTGPVHACALNEEGRAICWGDNGQGQLGDEIFGVRRTPGFTTDRFWSQIEPGMGLTCGIATSGEAFCWGLNHLGQLGTGMPLELSPVPQRVAGSLTFTTISAGVGHVCGLTRAGSAYCWGDNTALQLGGR